MSSFQLPPQLEGLRNINVPPQIKAVQAKIEYHVAQVDKEVRSPALEPPAGHLHLCCCAPQCHKVQHALPRHTGFYRWLTPPPATTGCPQLTKYPALVKAEQVTHVPKAWGVIGLFVFTTTAIFFNVAATFLTNLIGVVVPTYLSLRALETPGKDDDKQWCVLIPGSTNVVLLTPLLYWA